MGSNNKFTTREKLWAAYSDVLPGVGGGYSGLPARADA
jgi:hypothetical protein